MTDDRSEQAERRAIRRRWINVGEVVAVAGLIIAALSLYLGWSGRREDEAERRAEQAEARKQGSHVGLVATHADGDVLDFKGAACALQSADISFPTALGVATQSTTLDPHIDADWFAKPLLEAIAPSKAEKGRMPVLIESRCTGETGDRLERAVYDVPFSVDSRFLRGKTIRLRGLVLREYVTAANGQAHLDAAWRAGAPKTPTKHMNAADKSKRSG
ncbi:MAG: hypothetical protein ACXWJC_07325 [Croceibacterium sp.]